MKFFALSYIAALLAYGVTAQKPEETSVLQDPSILQAPAAHCWPVNEIGNGARMFRILYPGYAKLDTPENAKLKISFYKWDKKPSAGGVAKLVDGTGGQVMHSNVSQPWAFSFSMSENKVEKNAWYSVNFCIDKTGQGSYDLCSKVSEPATWMMDIGEGNQINCQEAGLGDRNIVDITSMASSDVMDYLKKMPTSLATKNQCDNSLERFTDSEGAQKIYAVPVYDLKPYKDILTDTTDNGFCKRKYSMSLLIHVMKKDTLQVMHRHRTTPYLPDELINKYVQDDAGEVPVETLIEIPKELNDKLGSGISEDYELQFTFCYDEKDKIETVKCSKPFTQPIPALRQ